MNNIDEENVEQVFDIVYRIKYAFFAIILIGMSIFLAFSANSNEAQKLAMIVSSISFLFGGLIAGYKVLPRTKTIIAIDKFADRMKLSVFVLIGIFALATGFMFKNIINVESKDWVSIFIFVVFFFAVLQMIYKNYIKK